MNFALTEMQAMIRDSLRRALSDGGGVAALADLGVDGLLLDEDQGGLGGDDIDAMIVMEELGRAVVANAYIETALIAGRLIAAMGNGGQRDLWLPRIATGSLTVAYIGADAGLSVTDDGTGPRLSGHAAIVPHAPVAGLLLVVASRDGRRELYLLAPDAIGLAITPFETVDGVPAGRIDFASVDAERLDANSDSDAALIAALDSATTAQCAERVGIMATLINATIEQLRTRRQFKTLLADFQALQHRLADMVMAFEMARSITIKAAIQCCGDNRSAREKAVSAARVQTAAAARLIGDEAVQMHGGMGMTEDIIVGRAVRRLQGIDARFDGVSAHARRYAAS